MMRRKKAESVNSSSNSQREQKYDEQARNYHSDQSGSFGRTNERPRKLHLKVNIPISAITIPTTKKKEEEKLGKKNKRLEDHHYTQSSPKHDVSMSSSPAAFPSTSISVNEIQPPSHSFFGSVPASNDLNHKLVDNATPSAQEHEKTNADSAFEQSELNANMDMYEPDSLLSCPVQSTVDDGNTERKHNFQNFVSEIKSRARNHTRRQGVPHEARNQTTTGPIQNFLSDFRSNDEPREGLFHIPNKLRRTSDRQNHPHLPNWLGSRGNRFNRQARRASGEPQSLAFTSDFPVHSTTHSSSSSAAASPPIHSPGILSNSSRAQFPRNVPFLGGRFFQNDAMPDHQNDESSPMNDSMTPNRFIPSKLAWTRRLDWKMKPDKLRRARSWSNTGQDSEENSLVMEQREESEQFSRLQEEVQSLRLALLRAEQSLARVRTQLSNHRQETRSKLKRISTVHNSLSDAQELRFRSAIDVLNDNHRVLGYVEANFDYVLSIVGSGRRRCPGLRGHFLGGLRYVGDNTIGCVFKIIRFISDIYASLKRVTPYQIETYIEAE